MGAKGTNGKTGSNSIPNGTKSWHSAYPELGTAPVPIEPYISPAFFELERERVFRRAWLCLGREEQIAKPGDFFIKDIAICNTSIIVARGQDGKVRAFHNVCSHRCNRVELQSRGSCSTFTCSFHGWCYGLDGRLIAAPDEKSFFDLDKSQLGLTPVAADLWQGFIFINLSSRPEQTLKEYLGEWGEQLRDYPYAENGAVCYEWSTEVRANWKLIRDAFKEAYHVAFLHLRSVRDSFTGPRNPFSHAIDFKLFPLHQSWSLTANPDYQPSPLEAVAYRYSPFLLKTDFTLKSPPGVNRKRDPNWVLDVNGVFPNRLIDLADTGYFSYGLWPMAVDRTRWEVQYYFPRPTTAAQRFSQEHNRVTFRDILMEDAGTLERIQSVIGSGAKTHFVFQDEEILLRHDNKILNEYMGLSKPAAKKRKGSIDARPAAVA